MSTKKIILVTTSFFGIFLIYCLVTYYLYPKIEARGQFGDMFGGLNALFSGLAFLGIIYTIALQREELGLQRTELELTRTELKRTASAQEKSESSLSKQAASLKITAKLNGLSAILQHQNTLIELTNSEKYGLMLSQFNERKKEADAIILEINDLIAGK